MGIDKTKELQEVANIVNNALLDIKNNLDFLDNNEDSLIRCYNNLVEYYLQLEKTCSTSVVKQYIYIEEVFYNFKKYLDKIYHKLPQTAQIEQENNHLKINQFLDDKICSCNEYRSKQTEILTIQDLLWLSEQDLLSLGEKHVSQVTSKIFPPDKYGNSDKTKGSIHDVAIWRQMSLTATEKDYDAKKYNAGNLVITVLRHEALYLKDISSITAALLKKNDYTVLIAAYDIAMKHNYDLEQEKMREILNNLKFLTKIDLLDLLKASSYPQNIKRIIKKCENSDKNYHWIITQGADKTLCDYVNGIDLQDDLYRPYFDMQLCKHIYFHENSDYEVKMEVIDNFLHETYSVNYYIRRVDIIVEFFDKILNVLREDQLNILKEKIRNIKKNVDAEVAKKYDNLLDNIQKAIDSKNSHLRVILPEQIRNAAMVAYNSINSLLGKLSSIARDLYSRFTSWWQGSTQKKYSYFANDETIKAVTSLVNYAFIQHLYNTKDSNIITFVEQNFNLNIFVENGESLSDEDFLRAVKKMLPRIDGDNSWLQAKLNKIQIEYIKEELKHAFNYLTITSQKSMRIAEKLSNTIFSEDKETKQIHLKTDISLESLGAYFKYANDNKQLGAYFEDAIIADNPKLFALMKQLKIQQQLFKMLHPDTGAFRKNDDLKQKIQNMYSDSQTQYGSLKIACDREKSSIFFEQLIKMVPDYYKAEIETQSNGYPLPEITQRDVEVFQNHAKIFPQQILQHFVVTYKDNSENKDIVELLKNKVQNIDNLLKQYSDNEWDSFINGYGKTGEIVYKKAFLESTKNLLSQTIEILHSIREIAEYKRANYEQSFLQRNSYDDLIRDVTEESLLIEQQWRDSHNNKNIYITSYNKFLLSLLQQDLKQAELGKQDIEKALLKVTDDDIKITNNNVKKLLLANRKLNLLSVITPRSDWSNYRKQGFNLYLQKITQELQEEREKILPIVAEQQAKLDFNNRKNRSAALPYEGELKQIFQQNKDGKNHYDANYKSLLQIEQKQQIDDIAPQAIVWFVANKLDEEVKFPVNQLINVDKYIIGLDVRKILQLESTSDAELRDRFNSFFTNLSKEHEFNYKNDEWFNLFKESLLESVNHVQENFKTIFKRSLDQLTVAIKDHNTNIALSKAFVDYKEQLIIRFQDNNLELPARGATLMPDFFTKYADLHNHDSIQEQLDEMTTQLHTELQSINNTIDSLILSNLNDLNMSVLSSQEFFVNHMRNVMSFDNREKIYITYCEILLKQKYNSLIEKINDASNQLLSNDKKGNLAQAVTKKQYRLEESEFSKSLSKLPAGYSTNKVIRQIFINQYQHKIQNAVENKLHEILEITNKDDRLQIIEQAVNFSIKHLDQQTTADTPYDKLYKLNEELRNIQFNSEQIIKTFFTRLSKDKKAQDIAFNEQDMYIGFQSEYTARYKAVLLEKIKSLSVTVAKLMIVDFVRKYKDQIITDSTLISYLDGTGINPINMHLPDKISDIVINSDSSFYQHLSKCVNIAAFETEFKRLLSSSLLEINKLDLASLAPREALSKLMSHQPQSILEEDHFVYQELLNLAQNVLETRLTIQEDQQALEYRNELLQQAINNTTATNTYGEIKSIKDKLVIDIENLVNYNSRHKDLYRQAINMFDTQYQTNQQASYDSFIEKDVHPIYTQITNLDKLANTDSLYQHRANILEQTEQLQKKYPALQQQLEQTLQNINQEINKKITALALQELRLSPDCVSLLQADTLEQVKLHMSMLRNASNTFGTLYETDINMLTLSDWLSTQEQNATSRVKQIESEHIQLIQDQWNNITKMLNDAKNISQVETIQKTKITTLLTELALVKTKYPAIDFINVTNIEQVVNGTKTSIQNKLNKLYFILEVSEDEQNDKQKILAKAVDWFIKHVKDIREITDLSDDNKYNWLQVAQQELQQNKFNVMSRLFRGLNRATQNNNVIFVKEDFDCSEFDSKFFDIYQRKIQKEINNKITELSVSQAVSLLAEIKDQLAYHKTLIQKNDLQKFIEAIEQIFEDEDELSDQFSLHNIIVGNKKQLIIKLNNYFKDPSIKEKFRESLITSLNKLKKVKHESSAVQQKIDKLQNSVQLEDLVYLQLLHITKESLLTQNASSLLDVHENIVADIGYITSTKPLTENVTTEEMIQRVTRLALDKALSEYKGKLNLQFSTGNLTLPAQQITLSQQFLDVYPLAAHDIQAKFNEEVTSFNERLQKIHDDIDVIISAQLQANLLDNQQDFVQRIMFPALISFNLVDSEDSSLYKQYLTTLLNDKHIQLNKVIAKAANSSVPVEMPANYKNNSIVLQAIINKQQINMQQMRKNKLYNILKLDSVVDVHHEEITNKAVKIAIDIFNESISSQDPYVRFEILQQELMKVNNAKNYQPYMSFFLNPLTSLFGRAKQDAIQSIAEQFFETLTKSAKFNPDGIKFNINDVYKDFGKDFTNAYCNVLQEELNKQVPLIAKLLVKDFLQQHRNLIIKDHDGWMMFINGTSLDDFKFNLPKTIVNITVNSDIANRLAKYIKVSDFEEQFKTIMLQGLNRIGSVVAMEEIHSEILQVGQSDTVEDLIYKELLIIKQELVTEQKQQQTLKDIEELLQQAINNTTTANTYDDIQIIKDKLVIDIKNLVISDSEHNDISLQAINMFDTQYQTNQQASYDNFIEKDVNPIYTQITNLDKLANIDSLFQHRANILEQTEQLKKKYPALQEQLEQTLQKVNQEINKKITALALQELQLSPDYVSLLQADTLEQVKLHMSMLRHASNTFGTLYETDINMLTLSDWLSTQEQNATSRVKQIESEHIQLIQDQWNNITKMLNDAKNISQVETIQKTKITTLLTELALVKTKYPAIDFINVTNIEQVVNGTKTSIQNKLNKLYFILEVSEDEQNDKQKILDKAVDWFIKHVKDIREITDLSDDNKYNWLQVAQQELQQNKFNVMSRFFRGLNRATQNNNVIFAKEDFDYSEFDSKFFDIYQRKIQEEIKDKITEISVSQAVSLLADVKDQLEYHKTLIQDNDLQKFIKAIEQIFEDEDELSDKFSLHNIIVGNKKQLIIKLNNYFKDPSIKEKFRESLIISLNKLKKVKHESSAVQQEIDKLQNSVQLEDLVYLQLLHITKESLLTQNASSLLDVHENIVADIGYITSTKPLTENITAEEMTQRVTRLALDKALSEYKGKLNLQFSEGNLTLPAQQITLSQQFLDVYPLAAHDIQAKFNEEVTSFNEILQRIHDGIDVIISAQLQANLLDNQQDFVQRIMLSALISFNLVDSEDSSLYKQYLKTLLNDKHIQLNKVIAKAANSSVSVDMPASYKNNSIVLQAINNKQQINMQQMRKNTLYNILKLDSVVDVHHEEVINKAVKIAIDIFNESILIQEPYVRFEMLQQELMRVNNAKNYQPSMNFLRNTTKSLFGRANQDATQSIAEQFFETLTKSVKFNPEGINFNVNDVSKNFSKDFTDSYCNVLQQELNKQVPLIAKLLIKDFLQQHRNLITKDHDGWVMFINGKSLDTFKFNLPKIISNITVNSDIANRLAKYIKVSDFEEQFKTIMLQGLNRISLFYNDKIKCLSSLNDAMADIHSEILRVKQSDKVEDLIYKELLIINQELVAKRIQEETSKKQQALAEAEQQQIALTAEQVAREAQLRLKQEALQLANAKQALEQAGSLALKVLKDHRLDLLKHKGLIACINGQIKDINFKSRVLHDIASKISQQLNSQMVVEQFKELMLQGLDRVGSFYSTNIKGLSSLNDAMADIHSEILRVRQSDKVEDLIYKELLIINQELVAKRIQEETSKKQQALAEAEQQQIALTAEQVAREAQLRLKQKALQLANAKPALDSSQLAHQPQVIVEKNDIYNTTQLTSEEKEEESKSTNLIKRKAEITQLAKSIMDQPFIKEYFIHPMSFFKSQYRISRDPLLVLNSNITFIEDTLELYSFATYITNEVKNFSEEIDKKNISQDQLANIEMKLNNLFKELDDFLISINRSFKRNQDILYISDKSFKDNPEKNVTTDSDSDYVHDGFNKSNTDTGIQQSSDFSDNSHKFDMKEKLYILGKQSKAVVNSAVVSILESVMFYMYYMYNTSDSKQGIDNHKLNILEKYLPINTSPQLYELIKELKPFNDEKKDFAKLDPAILKEISVVLQDINNFYHQVEARIEDLSKCETAKSFSDQLKKIKFIVPSRYIDSLRTFKRNLEESPSTTKSEEFVGDDCDSIAILFIKSHIDYFGYKYAVLAKNLGVTYKQPDYMDILREDEAYTIQEYDDYENYDDIALKTFKELLYSTATNKDKLNRTNELLRGIHPVLDEEGIPQDQVMMIPDAIVSVLEELGYSDILITEQKHIGNVINPKYINIVIALEKLLKLEQEKLVSIREFAQTIVNQNKPMLDNQYADKIDQQIFAEFYLDAVTEKEKTDNVRKTSQETDQELKELNKTATDHAGDHKDKSEEKATFSKPTINHKQEQEQQKQSDQQDKIQIILTKIKESKDPNDLLNNINQVEAMIQQEKINLTEEDKKLISVTVRDTSVQKYRDLYSYNSPESFTAQIKSLTSCSKSIKDSNLLFNTDDSQYFLNELKALIISASRMLRQKRGG